MSQTYSHMSCARSHWSFPLMCGVWFRGKWPRRAGGGGETERLPANRPPASVWWNPALFPGIIVSRHRSIAASQHRHTGPAGATQSRFWFPPPIHQIFVVFKMKNGETCWQETHKDVWCSVASFVFPTGGRCVCVWNVCHHLLRLVGIDRTQKKKKGKKPVYFFGWRDIFKFIWVKRKDSKDKNDFFFFLKKGIKNFFVCRFNDYSTQNTFLWSSKADIEAYPRPFKETLAGA